MAKKGYGSGDACLRKFAKDNTERHQLGFLGEKIGRQLAREDLKLKGVVGTPHKHEMDMITSRTGWEVKAVSKDAKDWKMTVKTPQRLKKEAWAKENKKTLKSMLIVVNDMIDVYTRVGVGGFRHTTMDKMGSYPRSKFKFMMEK